MFNDLKTLRTLRVTLEGHVLHVELNVPETGNLINGQVLDDLLAVLRVVDEDPTICVMVLSGAGDDFCLGGDRGEFDSLLDDDPSGSGLEAHLDKARRVCSAIATTKKITIARLHGKVIGAGVGLAVLCDFRVGAENTYFRLPELGLGVPPAWGGILPRLLKVAGPRIRELILTAEPFDALAAAELSILQRVVPQSQLDEVVKQWTRPLVRRPRRSLVMAKQMLISYDAADRLADGTYYDPYVLTAALQGRRKAS